MADHQPMTSYIATCLRCSLILPLISIEMNSKESTDQNNAVLCQRALPAVRRPLVGLRSRKMLAQDYSCGIASGLHKDSILHCNPWQLFDIRPRSQRSRTSLPSPQNGLKLITPSPKWRVLLCDPSAQNQ